MMTTRDIDEHTALTHTALTAAMKEYLTKRQTISWDQRFLNNETVIQAG